LDFFSNNADLLCPYFWRQSFAILSCTYPKEFDNSVPRRFAFISISGFNIAIVVALFITGFGWLLGRKWGTVTASGG